MSKPMSISAATSVKSMHLTPNGTIILTSRKDVQVGDSWTNEGVLYTVLDVPDGYDPSDWKICGWCFKSKIQDNIQLLTCGKCMTTKYCSKVCQKNHWSIHKSICEKQCDSDIMSEDQEKAQHNNT
jgi:hypothetical protein